MPCWTVVNPWTQSEYEFIFTSELPDKSSFSKSCQ